MSEKFIYVPLTDQEAEKLGEGITQTEIVTELVTDVISEIETLLLQTTIDSSIPGTENAIKNGNGTQIFFFFL